MNSAPVDKMDAKILHLLAQDGRMSWRDLADRIGLSLTPTLRRVRRLEEAGIISGYSARFDEQRLGFGITMYVMVTLEKQTEETLKVFGTTALVDADSLGTDLTEFGRAPKSVVVLTVQRAYFQCGKAVMRSGLWDPSRQVPRSVWPPFGEVLKDHCRLPAPLDEAELRAELATEL